MIKNIFFSKRPSHPSTTLRAIGRRVVTFMYLVLACRAPACMAHEHDYKNLIDLCRPEKKIVPLVVIGGGVAGYTAGIFGGNAKIHTLIITGDNPGGQLGSAGYVENMPGLERMTGHQIMSKMQSQATRFGVDIAYDTVSEIIPAAQGNYFMIKTADGMTIYALAVIIATGASPKKLGIAQEESYWARGVYACAICDAAMAEGKDIFVVGGGDAAVDQAIHLAAYARHVTILVRKGQMRAAPRMQEKLKDYANISVAYHKVVTNIQGDDEYITKLEIVDMLSHRATIVPCGALFLAIGHIPHSDVVRNLVACDKEGYIEKNEAQQTSIAGIFVAGDVADALYRLAGIAAADGIKAAIEAIAYLRNQGFNQQTDNLLAPYYLRIQEEAV